MSDGPEEGWTLPPKLFAEAVARAGVRALHRQRSHASRKIARVICKTGLVHVYGNGHTESSRGGAIAPMCWGWDSMAFPDALWRTLIPWCFDCWGPEYARWEAAFRRHRVPLAFFSARQCAEHFANAIPEMETIWLPEACDPKRYSPELPLAQRSLHVLELGRKLEAVHSKIATPLRAMNAKHVFSLDGANTVLFKGLDALYKGLGDTVIGLCYPKVLTHPDKAGGVETMTQRYLEFIGSGCLAVGTSPREIVELFGFDPVITLDMNDPARQIISILGDLPRWQAHADRSRARLLEVGTFDARARAMLGVLAKKGYVVPSGFG